MLIYQVENIFAPQTIQTQEIKSFKFYVLEKWGKDESLVTPKKNNYNLKAFLCKILKKNLNICIKEMPL